MARPSQPFVPVEVRGGLLLLAATAVALAWANSPLAAGYHSLFRSEVVLQVGPHRIAADLAHGINDALMAIFFLVVGLEIKREWVAGELRDRRAAALPVIAALGGMVVPAALYLAINPRGPAAHGWGVPMATDIAFALGVVAVLGRRVPGPLKVFLLTLAIADDIGAILLIALFYSGAISVGWLLAAVAVVATVLGLRATRVVHPAVYVALGMTLWLFVYRSGVHATIAGVAMGLLTPALPFRTSTPLTDRLIDLLHPWTSYLIVPLFALANAGIELRGETLTSPGPVLAGVFVGLVAGKAVGVAGASWLAIRSGIARLPAGVSWAQLVGAATLAGIGFTVSIFVANLAFVAGADREAAKVGVLVASVVAAATGSCLLWRAARRASAG